MNKQEAFDVSRLMDGIFGMRHGMILLAHMNLSQYASYHFLLIVIGLLNNNTHRKGLEFS